MQARKIFRMATVIAAADSPAMAAPVVIIILKLFTPPSDRNLSTAWTVAIVATPLWFALQCYTVIMIANRAWKAEGVEYQSNEALHTAVTFVMFMAAVLQVLLSPIAAGIAGTAVEWDQRPLSLSISLILCTLGSALAAVLTLGICILFLCENVQHLARSNPCCVPY
jgi:uncharacterized membrane protein